MVTVRFFAMLKGLAKTEAKDYKIADSLTVGGLKDIIKKDIPALREVMEGRSVLVSVNQEFARDNTPIKDGDEVAFLPPFSGG